ncbi:MAG: DUF349 domain-containing protein [Pseudomarimonas sp.]
MKLFGLLRKPDWDHKDPAIRLRAVQSSQDPILLGKLTEMVQTDPDPSVRAAALQRIDDPVLLERRLRGENEPSVAAAARKRLLERLCSPGMTVEAGTAVLLLSHDAELLARVATDSPHGALRKLALERCERPALLVSRCVQDPDPALRMWLLDRIDSPEALHKIALAARKSDKRLTKAAREKFEAQQLAAGDGLALQRRVLALCEQLARLSRELPADREQILLDLGAQWQQLRERADGDLARRADGALAMAEAALSAARGEPIPTRAGQLPDGVGTAVEVIAATTVAEVAVEAPVIETPALPEPAIDALWSQFPAIDAEDFDAQIAAIRAEARQYSAVDNTTVLGQLSALRAQLDALVGQRRLLLASALSERAAQQLQFLEQAISDGSLSLARTAREALGRNVPRELQRRLVDADEGLAKLERWAHWSTNKVRTRLCDEAEALRSSGVHPDALANKVKELKAEWTRLDGLDGAAAPGPEHGLTRRFNGLCARALAPARPYFEKRRELRGERSEQIASLIAEATTLPSTGDGLQALRKRVRDALPALDDAAPEKRGEQGRQLRERLAAIDVALQEVREQAALGKRRLLAKLRRDLGTADAASAVDMAKRAQVEWKALPRSERTLEDTLWTEFRALIDPLFERAREQETAQRTRSAEADSAAQAILAELDALATSEQDRLLHASAHLETLQARWRALAVNDEPSAASHERGARPARDGGSPRDSGNVRDKGARRDGGGQRDGGARDGRKDGHTRNPRAAHPLESRFEAAAARVQTAQQQALRLREAQHLANICAAGALLDQMAVLGVEQREALGQQFLAIELPNDAREPLSKRYQALLAGDEARAGASNGDADAAALLAVRAELSAGIESPSEALALRRQEQMRRLAAKLTGNQSSNPQALIRSLLIELQCMPGVSAGQRNALQARIMAAHVAAGE